ncbi:ABC transporter ATP-binding protein [Poseidonocella sp. HB161398]|uniref:ABC transporter ATP-binding protein n=1 Tax=Poseidonocella sp. HB161398 TaxID=2320855 RepID=UPI001108B938|nr:sn-glycerol-3-phosphate ABC transporter ATP-binding protein UgpC [Poseidonocella sp. HB161398]
MARVTLRNISKSYGQLEVIRDLSLDIEDGSFTVFVGPSGCGKSTLLRMIAGLEPITGGDLMIGGTRANDLDPVARGIAMVFQNYALYPHMTVEKNIAFSLKMAGYGRAEIARRVAEAAEVLQIGHLLGRRPANLSGGQRQRVAIGRAIVRDPAVFLFDEPLSNLDAELRVSMRSEIAQLHQRLTNTMIYVTHDQTEAMTMADRIVVLREGRIEQTGTPQELYEDPANAFVAGFIGSPRMNFLPARASGSALELPGGARLGCAGDGLPRELSLGIRPEAARPGREGGGLRLEMEVALVEYLGGTRYLHGHLADGTAMLIEARSAAGIRPGDRLPFTCPLEALRAFAPDGARLRSLSLLPAEPETA